MREGVGPSAAVRASTLTSTSDDVILADRAPDGRNAAQTALVQPGAEEVPCASLKEADSPRLDGESIDHITVLAQAGVQWPPIVVHRQTLRVIDGMHRLRAAQLRGDQSVEVKFFDGDAGEMANDHGDSSEATLRLAPAERPHDPTRASVLRSASTAARSDSASKVNVAPARLNSSGTVAVAPSRRAER